MMLETCPREYTADLIPLLTAVDMFDRGFLPIAGGWLDQAVNFVRSVEAYKSFEARYENGE